MNPLMFAKPPAGKRQAAPIPPRAGIGLKPEHTQDIMQAPPDVGWFEVHAENYMGAGGAPHRFLEWVRERYPLSVHGVGLSIGGAAPLDKTHLRRLKALLDRYEPGLFSEHLAWSTHDGAYLNDLLPLPYTAETLAHVAAHVDQAQDALGRQILIENPSTYIAFEASDMAETELLRGLARRTGCALLLDVNNVYVSAQNHGFDAEAYLRSFPAASVREIHLAGFFEAEDSAGEPFLIDAHDSPVRDAVWALYARAIQRTGAVPTLIEWDNEIPALATLAAQAAKADAVAMAAEGPADAVAMAEERPADAVAMAADRPADALAFAQERLSHAEFH
jgi:uncharacterized protein